MISRSIWFTQDVPFSGEIGDRLAQQARMHVPGKVIPGSLLRLELCAKRGDPVPPSAIDAIVQNWLLPTEADVQSASPSDRTMTGWLDRLGQFLTHAELDWTQIEDRLEWELPHDGHARRCVGTVRHSWARLQANVALLPNPIADVRHAVEHNLVAMNGRMRGSRASLADQRVTVEVVIPVDRLAEELTRALGALRRETASLATTVGWLQQADIAERYVDFHRLKKGGEDYESQCRSRRLEPLAGSR